MFAPGRRPRADDVAELARQDRSFGISHRPREGEGWLELLINGLTYDLTGLAPAAPAAAPPVGHRFGVARTGELAGEAVALAPGPHLGAGRAMPPVIRGAVALGVSLAKLEGVEFVCWHPARSAVAREVFARSSADWLAGGAFPALGLTSLYAAPDGSMCSEGLALFTGQELALERGSAVAAEDAKLAMRLIDRLVVHGPLSGPQTWPLGPSARVRLEPAAGGIVRAWRQTA